MPVMNLYEILEAAPTASAEELRAAYIQQSKKHHPDQPGGSKEAFQEVGRAYKVLSNALTRAEYDTTGAEKPTERMSIDELAEYQVRILFEKYIDEGLHENLQADVIEHLHMFIMMGEDAIKRREKDAEKKLEALAKFSPAIRRSSGAAGTDMLGQIMAKKKAELEATVRGCEHTRRVNTRALELIHAYKYVAPPEPPPQKSDTWDFQQKYTVDMKRPQAIDPRGQSFATFKWDLGT